MKSRSAYSFLPFVLTVALAAGLWAGPTQINYQGRLTRSDGSPVPDSAYSVLFTLYPDSITGSVVWAENATVHTTGGMFSHLLGSTLPFASNLFTNYDRLYLEIRLGSEILGPRTLFASVARAAVAGDIKSVDSAGKPSVRTFADQHKVAIYDAGGNEKVVFQDKPGDDAVILPDSSINSEEILDEPGIATNTNISLITLVTGEMQDLVLLDVTIPNDGYIVLFGKCYVLLSGTTGANSAVVQIDENEGGGTQFPYYDIVGLSGYVNSGTNYFPVFVTRTYYKARGTYTFRMEGRASNASPALAQTWDHVFTAEYFPTAYYGAKAILSSPMGDPNAIPIVVDSIDSIRTPGTYYEMDLRYFEDKDKAEKKRR